MTTLRSIELLREKLEAFRQEEAITADTEKKFALGKKIEALEAKIAGLQGVTPGQATDKGQTAPQEDPLVDEPHGIFADTIQRAGARVRQLGVYIGAIAALVGGYYLLREKLGMPGQQALAIASVPFLLTLLTETLPAWLTRRRDRRLVEIGVRGPLEDAGYFKFRPYEEGEAFSRADDAHTRVLHWLVRSKSPLLTLSGRSGSGKSSLLNAAVLPELREHHGFRVLKVRGFDDPLGVLVGTLRKPGALWKRPPKSNDARELLERACTRRDAGRLLVVVDQFEEFLILGQEAERRSLVDFLRSLTERPIPVLRVLLVVRTDYLGPLEELDLPALHSRVNWTEVSPFTEAAARAFLNGSGLDIGTELMEEILREAAVLEENRGLVRPITLNMFGTILARYAHEHARKLPKGFKPGHLLRGYLTDIIGQPRIRERAPQLLRQMITSHGTKQRRSVAALAETTAIRPGLVRGCLFALAKEGLVRPLDEKSEFWEVSHDFLARLLDQVLARWRASFFARLQPSAAPTLLVLWLGAALILAPFYLRLRAVEALFELGCTAAATSDETRAAGDSYRVRCGGHWPLAKIATHLKRLSVADLSLSSMEVADLTPLQALDAQVGEVQGYRPLVAERHEARPRGLA